MSTNASSWSGRASLRAVTSLNKKPFGNPLFLQARNYIQSLTQMPKMNFANVFIGANPLGKLTVSSCHGYEIGYDEVRDLKSMTCSNCCRFLPGLRGRAAGTGGVVGPGTPRRVPCSSIPTGAAGLSSSRTFPSLLLLLRDLAILTGANLPPQALRNGPIFLPPSLPEPLAKGHDWQLQDVYCPG